MGCVNFSVHSASDPKSESDFFIHSASDPKHTDPQYDPKHELLELLQGSYSNFYALTEHPTTVGDFPPLLQQAEIITLAQGEPALLVSQGFLMAGSSTTFTPEESVRRYLYVFVTPRHSSDLVQVMYPLTADITAEFLAKPDALNHLTRLPGCEIRWQHEVLANGEHGFSGYRQPQRCFFMATETNTPVHLETILQVGANEQQVTDNFLDQNGEPLAEMEPGGTLILNPIRFFEMTVSFLPEGANKDDVNAWISIQPDGLIHDQGQRVNLRMKDSQQMLPYQIKLLRAEEQAFSGEPDAAVAKGLKALANKANKLQVWIYSLGSEEWLQELSVELEQGRGVLYADPLRVELQLRTAH